MDAWHCIHRKSGRTLLVTCIHTGFLSVLVLDPEDGGNMFLQHLDDFQWTTQHYIPEDRTLRQ
jgi:hypothetical protein